MSSSRRRPRVKQDTPWPSELLYSWRAYYVDSALAPSSRLTYASALHSYKQFCTLHSLDFQPTPDTLSLFITFKSHAISPNSVSSYLSAVVSQLEPFYPDVRVARQAPLVKRTLAGIQRIHSCPVVRKQPLTVTNLQLVSSHLSPSSSHDDLLFLAQLFLGFDQLLRLAELDRKSVV